MSVIHLEHMDVVSELMCDCGGKMKFDGISFEILPVLYKHICESCSELDYNVNRYPNIDYRNVFLPVMRVFHD